MGLVAVGTADLHRAIFVLRDLAYWVELRVGEDIGRGLHIGERYEDRTLLHGPVSTSGKLDRAAARGHPDPLARLDAVTGKFPRVEARRRSRFERIEHIGAARHCTSMPMLQLPPSHQYQRIFVIGH